MPLLCLPGDGPKLGLGPAMSLPRAKAPNGRSLGPNQLGEVPRGSGRLEPFGHGKPGSYYIAKTHVTHAWEGVLKSPL